MFKNTYERPFTSDEDQHVFTDYVFQPCKPALHYDEVSLLCFFLDNIHMFRYYATYFT